VYVREKKGREKKESQRQEGKGGVGVGGKGRVRKILAGARDKLCIVFHFI